MIPYHANPDPPLPTQMSKEELEFYNKALAYKAELERKARMQRYLENRNWFDSFSYANEPAFG